jgi:uncharacterized protein YegL
VRELALWVNGERVVGDVQERKKATYVYQGIVNRMQDPALLNYIGRNTFSLRIFPIEPYSERRIELSYVSLVSRNATQLTYTLPALGDPNAAIGQVFVSVSVQSAHGLTELKTNSPLATARREADKGTVTMEAANVKFAEAFQVTYRLKQPPAVMVSAWRDNDGGYFALQLPPIETAPVKEATDAVILLDTSRSMSCGRLEQAKRVVEQLTDDLTKQGARIAVVPFDNEPRAVAEDWVTADDVGIVRVSLSKLSPRGVCNLEEALARAAEYLPQARERMAIVLVTSGYPSLGARQAENLRLQVEIAKTETKKKLTFVAVAVGNNANTYLLERLAQLLKGRMVALDGADTRALQAAILPHTVLTDARARLGKSGVYEVYPKGVSVTITTPLIVVGRYDQGGATTLTLTGWQGGFVMTKQWQVTLPDKPNAGSGVEALWAKQQIDFLADDMKKNGENDFASAEIVELSKRHRVLTPHTSLLVIDPQFGAFASSLSQQFDAQQAYQGRGGFGGGGLGGLGGGGFGGMGMPGMPGMGGGTGAFPLPDGIDSITALDPRNALTVPGTSTVTVTPSSNGKVSVDFRNASITEVLDALFKARPGANKIVKQGVVGTVNLSLKDIDWDTALKYSVEQVKARVRKDDNGVYVIEPDPKFSQQANDFNPAGLPPMPDTSGGGINVGFAPPDPDPLDEKRYHVIAVLHVDAATVTAILGGQVVSVPLKGQPAPRDAVEIVAEQFAWGGGVLPVPEGIDSIIGIVPRNTLLVYATEEGARKLRDLVSLIDVPLEQVAVQVTALEMKAEDVKELLSSGEDTGVLTAQQTQTALKRLANKVRVVAKPRLTTVSGHPAEIAVGATANEGCRLHLAPTVMSEGNIALQVRVEVNRLNRLSTILNLPSGNSAVLSGIQRSNGKVLAVIITPRHVE